MDRYSDRKIIVWAASTHISRNAEDAAYYQKISNEYTVLAPDYKQMGNYVYDKYGDKVYSIAFTAYQGSFFNYLDFKNHHIEKPDENSLEHYFNLTNEEYLFVNYRSELHDWMNGVFISTVFGYNNVKNDWANSFDAIFYTRNMEASHYNP